MDENKYFTEEQENESEKSKVSGLDRKMVEGFTLGLVGSSIIGIGTISSGYLAPRLAGQASTEDPRGKNGQTYFQNMSADQKGLFLSFETMLGLGGLIVACTSGVKLKRYFQSFIRDVGKELDKEKDKPLYVNFY